LGNVKQLSVEINEAVLKYGIIYRNGGAVYKFKAV
jgi:hypothetical protein